ncbi:hypothetical protein F4703DRAFT_1932899 [Phycomyces blakesleeanus]|uniref:N-acetyltransferase domain-containing protein n=1 Tax=Phycomyces blakesleeanus (strain ATCC 8743b / DSM 1359 / FGSC 10004 / NBRC 33097 / NRRL 1555) TaxID=763407 RepID=A0A162ZXK9_PHYB8|nr:hypothetical protein PHYBLDRAFT_78285 [Phycomyces blakesleeanus NRRL 1555(-)]OAD69681.1 hypothetical protein PHYBLDRAFT_78285 [Phycomyces blakesleeanus NRRL 1555(-)]|eukprot:XP_018287721.1 hypothetical protein PHYBLDRAFT_78285 [Phycomyces blakesleeanus NRRL 1555(-)]
MPSLISHAESEPLSRQLTVTTDPTVNVRHVVKGAIKEASHTLTDAYASDAILGWCARGLEHSKHDSFLYNVFKNLINSSSLQSRDFVVQVDGCQGVLVWSNLPQGCSWTRAIGTVKLARLTGWASAVRAFVRFQPTCDKMRRKVMAEYSQEYITIGFLGVLSHQQHKGLGGTLLRHVLEKADASHYPVYVEVNHPDTVKFFEHFGFVIRASAQVSQTPGLSVYFMVRDFVSHIEPKPLRIRPGRRISYQ